MKKILIIMCIATIVAMTACGSVRQKDDSAKSETKSADTGKSILDGAYAIKYDCGGSTVIFTKSADGKRMRLDYIYEDGDKDICIQDYSKDNGYIGYKYEYGVWEDDSYMAQQTVGMFEYGNVKDLSETYIQHSFTKQANEKILGKNCQIYSGIHPKDMKVAGYSAFNLVGAEEEIAVWNGITMRLKSQGKIDLEAKFIVTKVPDEAFSKTTEVTWIK